MTNNKHFTYAENLISALLKSPSLTSEQIIDAIEKINGLNLEGKLSGDEASFLILKLPKVGGAEMETENFDSGSMFVEESGFDVEDQAFSGTKKYTDDNDLTGSGESILSGAHQYGFSLDDGEAESQFYTQDSKEKFESVLPEKITHGFSADEEDPFVDAQFYNDDAKVKEDSVMFKQKTETGFSSDEDFSSSRFYNRAPPQSVRTKKTKAAGFSVDGLDELNENDEY